MVALLAVYQLVTLNEPLPEVYLIESGADSGPQERDKTESALVVNDALFPLGAANPIEAIPAQHGRPSVAQR